MLQELTRKGSPRRRPTPLEGPIRAAFLFALYHTSYLGRGSSQRLTLMSKSELWLTLAMSRSYYVKPVRHRIRRVPWEKFLLTITAYTVIEIL
jgi:hypothetical protein